jgi:uncharacterized membrane protein
MTSGVFAHIRTRLLRGVILVLPLLVTVWLLSILFDLINSNVTPLVRRLLEWSGIPGLELWFARLGIPLVSLFLTVVFIYLLGLLGGYLAARRLLTMIESWILRIPLVKSIYGSARQLLDAFSFTGKRAFSKVVLVEYPRRGLWTFGFVTTEVEHRLRDTDGPVATVPVFLPTTPNPTSGWMMLVPTHDLRIVDMSIEAAVKLIVSGGIVSPDDVGALMRPWSAERP